MVSGNAPTIGFIGLGQMGAPMVRNLIEAGHRPVVHNRSRAIVETIAAEGADPAGSAREVAERVDILFTCVGFPADVERVYLGRDGAIEGARAGQVFCDLSTVGPDTIRPSRRAWPRRASATWTPRSAAARPAPRPGR
jgi:3-hydroxyisobutyrate dehydrogenase-like beta-hydroxyacid dehydrogenase